MGRERTRRLLGLHDTTYDAALRDMDLRARSDAPVPPSEISGSLTGLDWAAEIRAMQREDEKLALEALAKPRKRKIRIRKPRP